ncbi:MAG: ATP-dependent Clp protease ATP-binding subunit [Candidatus Doudnabacteria bacterium]|nr:ATP-dependent Clp protease ATP-binding subunit [Candidatus Doudnabacteria bacterium]
MSTQNKISYYDLKLETLKLRLFPIVGRVEESQRLSRIVNRNLQNNIIVTGPRGIGKTAFIRGWAMQNTNSNFGIVEIDSESFYGLQTTTLPRFQEAFERLPECLLIIDDFGALVYNKPVVLQHMSSLLKAVLSQNKIRVLITATLQEQTWMIEQDPGFANNFETIALKKQTITEYVNILSAKIRQLSSSKQSVSKKSLELIVTLCEKFSNLGQLPHSAITILDEVLALAAVHKREVTEHDVYQVIADKTGIPVSQLEANEIELLKKLEPELNARIIGQDSALKTITTTIQRAKLGLKNPNRPLGSFLVLGPSGVGKTETAKLLAEKVFGKKENFLRFDMSEFGQEHSAQRLIGAPPGYVGYDAGGGLTDPVIQEPYSLILLDEIEKAHPKIFDIFLQVLDDGRLTSGKSETVDFTQTIVMATSNIGVPEIITGFNSGHDINSPEFIEQQVIPVLSKHFRIEFLNRFDAILIFKPLTTTNLLDIARLEISKIEERVKKHHISFNLDSTILSRKVAELSDPRFGARPVKRFVETTCETLITKALLQ